MANNTHFFRQRDSWQWGQYHFLEDENRNPDEEFGKTGAKASHALKNLYPLADLSSKLLVAGPQPDHSLQNASLIAANQAVNGHVWVQKQFITVRWAWLTLPTLSLILACGFLLAAFVKTRQSRVGLWQSSPLIFLFHAQLPDEARKREWKVDELNTADQMESAAEKLCMKITNGDDAPLEVFLNSAVPGRARDI
ncbi:hypothetical protein LHYA1_G008041 [Lachnellula hyalina]|uniref:Uncharacterized protein n=1 Tax=Lachnellula hyalina TaxID=1316788 RepID=A0A8H8QWS2_9HELO|nr:uncharacterized protein LHYA1_G008041 [Lachnellula hyalina]TVY23956.1 hypothetical protein LHYA1_G008041 [Lachnellula hyalina]